MEKQILINSINEHVNSNPKNYVDKSLAITQELIGLKMYEEPLVGFADANNPYFEKFKSKDIIGENYILPAEWNAEAKTVVSIFLPFSDRVKKSNRVNPNWPSNEWLHARIEGQTYIKELCLYIKNILETEGYKTVVPALDERFSLKSDVTTDKTKQEYYTSNWSERHAAFVCGLGTFGLSKGIITAKGMAGRYGSVITDAYFEPTKAAYTDVYEYCSRCGACVKNCPVKAISLKEGKIHPICSEFLDRTMEKYKPRYGCGKCQVKVPCENGIPIHQY
jgi:epoxyqueuosine reductase QueG